MMRCELMYFNFRTKSFIVQTIFEFQK
uniref:Uncharacterized protein n=1 Tax=Arundo donax TaxID=35708 RepID=A0A0A9B122_ARUDO